MNPSLLPAAQCRTCGGDLSSASPGTRVQAYYLHVEPVWDGHEPYPRRVSIDEVRAAGEGLPHRADCAAATTGATGVYWTHTDRLECDAHLLSDHPPAGPYDGLPLGIVLYDDRIDCDAEAGRGQ
jgi:hypothetical protein